MSLDEKIQRVVEWTIAALRNGDSAAFAAVVIETTLDGEQ